MTVSPDEITAGEKSLLAIWWKSHRIHRTGFNRWCMLITCAAMAGYLYLTRQTPHEIAEMVRSWANVGLGFAGTILGFLVAGFTIFATLSKPSLLVSLATHIEEQSGLTYLKYNFFVFFETFGWYVGFAGACIVVLVFAPIGGAATQLMHALPKGWLHTVELIASRGSALIVGSWFVLICLELKSFVYNIYHVVMTSIRWNVENPEPTETCKYEPTPRQN